MQDLTAGQSPWEPLGTDQAGVVSPIHWYMIGAPTSSSPTIPARQPQGPKGIPDRMRPVAHCVQLLWSVKERSEKLRDLGHHTYFLIHLFIFADLEMEPRALHMLSTCSITVCVYVRVCLAGM